MSTREQVFRAHSEGVERMVGWPLAVHEPECIGTGMKAQYTGQCDCRTIRMLVIEVMRQRLTAAESRVAELEAGIRRLSDEAEPVILAADDPLPDKPVLAVAVADLRALVGDEPTRGHDMSGEIADGLLG